MSCYGTNKTLQGDYPEPSQTAPESARRPIEACETLHLSADVQAALQKLKGSGEGPDSSFGILLSAFVVLVSRLTGDENITVGTSNDEGTPFVLRTAVDLKESFADLSIRIEEVKLVKWTPNKSCLIICSSTRNLLSTLCH